jgi:hypothetical protein
MHCAQLGDREGARGAIDGARQKETEQPDHSASLGDSITSSTRIGFSVHTGGRMLAKLVVTLHVGRLRSELPRPLLVTESSFRHCARRTDTHIKLTLAP